LGASQVWFQEPAPRGISHAVRCGRRACRFQRRRITGSVCSGRAQARDVSHASAWHLAARHPARVISASAGQGKFSLVVSFRLRQSWPNYSLKRTVQSLRDWSCRLAQALGLGCNASSVRAACAVLHLAHRPLRPPRIPLSAAADHRFGWFLAGAGTRQRAGISVAPGSETSGERDFGKCGAGQVFALPSRSGSGSLGLTIRSSGPLTATEFSVSSRRRPLSSGVRPLVQ